jgi:methylenetetrahydrofolate dehydrogenase (NADP+)/methenyltetrahydrofolate cyclohydrolase
MAGGPLAERIRAQVAQDVKGLGGIGLATVQVGEDPSSTVYIRRKHEAAGEAVIASTDLKLPEDITQEELVAAVELLNLDDQIDGILIQLPLPRHLDEAQAVLAIDPVKDVDAVHPFNAGQLYLGRPTLVPATPLGIMALLEEYQIGLDGTRAVVIGRSDIVGKPIAHLLLQANATVTICHSHTDLSGTRSTRTCWSQRPVCRGSSRRTWSSPARQWWMSGSTAPRRAWSATSTLARPRSRTS